MHASILSATVSSASQDWNPDSGLLKLKPHGPVACDLRTSTSEQCYFSRFSRPHLVAVAPARGGLLWLCGSVALRGLCVAVGCGGECGYVVVVVVVVVSSGGGK